MPRDDDSAAAADAWKQWKSVGACVLYGSISISITFFNKAVLSLFGFPYPNIMTLVQMVFSLTLLSFSKFAGIITYPDFDAKIAWQILPLVISFIGMVLTGLGALRFLNIPMFNALRRATTLITMYGQFYMEGKSASTGSQVAVYAMVAGAMLAGLHDLTYNATGYFLVALNCFFTAGYLLSISKFKHLNDFGLMFYNNLLSIPLVVLICLALGEFQALPSYPHLYTPSFQACFLVQATLAFFLNYAIFLCTSMNSPLATSVTGQIKNVLTSSVGYFVFGDVIYHLWNVFGLIFSAAASAWYAYIKYQEGVRRRKQASKAESVPLKEIVASSDDPSADSKDGAQ